MFRLPYMPGLTLRDSQRLAVAMLDVAPYLPKGRWSHAGGPCERHWIRVAGIEDELGEVPFNGADLIIDGGMDKVDPRITQVCRIAHYHPGSVSGAYGAAVHIGTGTTIQFYPPRWHATVDGVVTGRYGGDVSWPNTTWEELMPGFGQPVQSLGQQMVSVLQDLRKLETGESVDPKQFRYMELMEKAAEKLRLWEPTISALNQRMPTEGDLNRYSGGHWGYYMGLIKAFEGSHPDRIVPELHTSRRRRWEQLTHRCKECRNSGPFKLTPMWRIEYTMLTRRGARFAPIA